MYRESEEEAEVRRKKEAASRKEREEEDLKKRLADFEEKRKKASDAIAEVRGRSNPDALPLSEVVDLLPGHPEWNICRKRKK